MAAPPSSQVATPQRLAAYYKLRIDHEHLAKHARGLIGMSACLKGEVAMAIHQDDDYAKAKKIAGEYREENFSSIELILRPEPGHFLKTHNVACEPRGVV